MRNVVGQKAVAAVLSGLLTVSTIAPVAAFADNSPSVGSQTGTGKTDLTMILEDTSEHGGTAVDPTNPDEIGGGQDGQSPDGLGDNLAFTVPSSINYVVKADGSLVGPSEGVAYIENRSAFSAHVSAMDVDPETGFTFVADASASSTANSVDLQIGPAADMLQASSYLTKADVTDAAKWNMSATGNGNVSKVLLKSEGDVSHIDKDITSQTKFGTVKWYVTPGQAEESITASYCIGYIDNSIPFNSNDLNLTIRGTKVFDSTPTGNIMTGLGVSETDWEQLTNAIYSNPDYPYITACYITRWSIMIDGDDNYYEAASTWESVKKWDDASGTYVPVDIDSFKGKTIYLDAEVQTES